MFTPHRATGRARPTSIGKGGPERGAGPTTLSDVCQSSSGRPVKHEVEPSGKSILPRTNHSISHARGLVSASCDTFHVPDVCGPLSGVSPFLCVVWMITNFIIYVQVNSFGAQQADQAGLLLVPCTCLSADIPASARLSRPHTCRGLWLLCPHSRPLTAFHGGSPFRMDPGRSPSRISR